MATTVKALNCNANLNKKQNIMSFPTKLTDRLYASKEGKLNNYGDVDQLDTLAKYDLFRLDKVNENGIAITLATCTSTKFTSAVGKAALEKGVKPVEIEIGKPLVFGLNCNAKDREGKDNPDYALTKQFLLILEECKVETGKIYFAKLDMGSVAPKTSLKMIKAMAGDCFEFVPVEDFNYESAGQSEELWLPVVEAISGEKFVEGKTYQAKKTKDVLFKENIVALGLISEEELVAAYLAVYPQCEGDPLVTDTHFEEFCNSTRLGILLSF
jgi:hypothetical protein